MKLSSLMVVSAVISAIGGLFIVVWSFMGGLMIAGVLSPILIAAGYFGFAALNWSARNAQEGQALRAIVLANFVSALIGFLLASLGQLNGGANMPGLFNVLGWVLVAFYLIFALAFGYFQFMRPSRS